MTRVGITILVVLAVVTAPRASSSEELYPKHIDARTQKSIERGLDYLAKTQSRDGNWNASSDGAAYPTVMASLAGMAFLANGNTPSRGPFAENVRRAELFVMGSSRPGGLITDPAESNGRSMYGHGFSMLFLSTVYGMETEPRTREALKKVVTDGIDLTARAQSAVGGWTYIPGGGDEGSVTVTQMQGLRAASNAGFTVPKGTVEKAVKYLEMCRTPEGGIRYAAYSGGGPRLAISAAAICTLYNAGEYDSRLAEACVAYVWAQFELNREQWSKGGGHDFYTHLYASQAFYQAGDQYWDDYFPRIRDHLLRTQKPDGSWDGDGIGPVYGTSVALIILQLPYKFVPIFQR